MRNWIQPEPPKDKDGKPIRPLPPPPPPLKKCWCGYDGSHCGFQPMNKLNINSPSKPPKGD